MHVDLKLSDLDHDHACDLLEAVCEGVVLANMLEIRADEEAFPCCIKCGELKLFLGGNPLAIEGARAVVKRGGGNALSLACFQAAARRIEKDPRADVIIDHVEKNGEIAVGEYKPFVRLGDDKLEDVEHEAARNGDCGCSGEGHEDHDHDDDRSRNGLWGHIPPYVPPGGVVFHTKRRRVG